MDEIPDRASAEGYWGYANHIPVQETDGFGDEYDRFGAQKLLEHLYADAEGGMGSQDPLCGDGRG